MQIIMEKIRGDYMRNVFSINGLKIEVCGAYQKVK